MIDPELRNIIAPELAEGEELLWAEKTSLEMRKAWAKSELKSAQNTFKMLIGLSVFLTLVVFAFDFWRNDIRVWILIPYAAIVGMSFLGAVLHPQKKEAKYLQQREIGGYALSNLRFFTLDLSLSISDRRDAKKIKWAKPFRPRLKWVTTNLTLSPVGSGWIKRAELYFLKNFKASENYINSKIQRISP